MNKKEIVNARMKQIQAAISPSYKLIVVRKVMHSLMLLEIFYKSFISLINESNFRIFKQNIHFIQMQYETTNFQVRYSKKLNSGPAFPIEKALFL